MGNEHREHILQARELLELAAQTPEGRQDLCRWLGQVVRDLEEAEPGADDAPAGEPATAWNEHALARSGLTVALSETADAGCELRPATLADHYAVSAAGPDSGFHDNEGGRQAMDPTEEDLREFYLADESARLGLMVQAGGPARPSYAGAQLGQPAASDEVDHEDLAMATLELAARTGGRASFGEVVDAVDELALSRSGEARSNETGARASALAELARRLPAADDPADEAAALELARAREIGRFTGQGGPVLDARISEIIARNSGILSDAPRRGQTYVAQLEDEDNTDHRAPRKGGELHPEVRRILEQHGVLIGWDPNSVTRPKSALQREAEEQRAGRAGLGLYSITDLHRGALRTLGSRGR